ncbi:MAG: hypothetical protein SGPRY_010532 [Prymnesium sp.]
MASRRGTVIGLGHTLSDSSNDKWESWERGERGEKLRGESSPGRARRSLPLNAISGSDASADAGETAAQRCLSAPLSAACNGGRAGSVGRREAASASAQQRLQAGRVTHSRGMITARVAAALPTTTPLLGDVDGSYEKRFDRQGLIGVSRSVNCALGGGGGAGAVGVGGGTGGGVGGGDQGVQGRRRRSELCGSSGLAQATASALCADFSGGLSSEGCRHGEAEAHVARRRFSDFSGVGMSSCYSSQSVLPRATREPRWRLLGNPSDEPIGDQMFDAAGCALQAPILSVSPQFSRERRLCRGPLPAEAALLAGAARHRE